MVKILSRLADTHGGVNNVLIKIRLTLGMLQGKCLVLLLQMYLLPNELGPNAAAVKFVKEIVV